LDHTKPRHKASAFLFHPIARGLINAHSWCIHISPAAKWFCEIKTLAAGVMNLVDNQNAALSADENFSSGLKRG